MMEILTEPSFWTIVLFLVPAALGFPIGVCMGLAATSVAFCMDLGASMISFNFFANIAKFPLLAVPFFVLAGVIMERTGIAERLVNFIKECVGATTGGLAIATIVVATFWGALSGSANATVAALGVILIPGMVRAGYDKPFATATVCVSAAIAVIIPPSISFIIYSTITGVSVSAQLAAGILPGLVMAGCLMVSAYITSYRKGYKGEPRKGNLLAAFREAFWALLAPLIILGGIYGGIFTPTEAAAVAVFYGLFVGAFVYRNLTWKMFYEILAFSAATTAIFMILAACGGLYSWVASAIGMIDKVSALIMGVSENQWVVLFVINIILLIGGMIVDGFSLFYVFIPLLMPVIRHFGWDPIWFGVVITINVAIGGITPPVASNLFVGTNVSGLTLEELVPSVLPLLLAAVICLAIICAFPALSTYLPRLWGLML